MPLFFELSFVEDFDAEDWPLDWTGEQGAEVERRPQVAARGCRGFGREVSTPFFAVASALTTVRDCIEEMRFTCTSCGKVHEGLPSLTFAAPYYYDTVPEDERGKRCILTSDLCSIDDQHFFIRGGLEIPIIDQSELFIWGVWCSVSRVNFDRYLEVFNEPYQSHVGPFFGWFSTRLPDYPETLSLKVMTHLRDHKTPSMV